jgi:hypothetical protein
MSNPNQKMVCPDHGESYATFICQHLCGGRGLGFFFADENDPEELRPDAWCGDCDRLLAESGGRWSEKAEAAAGVTSVCARCYDGVRRNNEVPFKRIRPQFRPNLEEDGWELASAHLQHKLNPESFLVPSPSELGRIRVGDLVKLLFLIVVEKPNGPMAVECERMWVVVEEVNRPGYAGALVSRPVLSNRMQELLGTIRFHGDHVAAIHRNSFGGRVGELLWSRLERLLGIRGRSKFRHVRPSENTNVGTPNSGPQADA